MFIFEKIKRMKRNTLHFLTLASLLSFPAQAKEITFPGKPIFSQPLPTYVYGLTLEKEGEEPQPIYNLFYISQMLANKSADLNTVGYINYLIDKKYENDKDKNSTRNLILGHSESIFLKDQIKNELIQILLKRLGEPNVQLTSDVKELDLNYISEKYLDNDKNLKNKLDYITKLNKELDSIQKIPTLYPLNENLNEIFGKGIINLEGFNEQAFAKFNNEFNEILNKEISIDKVIHLQSVFDILNLKFTKEVTKVNKLGKNNQDLNEVIIPNIQYVELTEEKLIKELINIESKKYSSVLMIEIDDNYVLKVLPEENEGNNDIDVSKTKIKSIFQKNLKAITTQNINNLVVKYNIKETFKIEGIKSPINFTQKFLKIKENYSDIRDRRDLAFNALLEAIINRKIVMNSVITDSKIQQAQANVLRLMTLSPVVESPNTRSNSGWKLPSESDVIMGVAKFMANRAKQETMIWFVHNLQKEMENSLMLDAFPQTYEQIKESDPLKTFNFTGSIQLALAEDFVKLPYNIIGGNWLANKVTSENTNLKILQNTMRYSSHLFSLMNGKNSYRSILENLHIQKPYFLKNLPEEHMVSDLSNAIDLLYILANEFYTVQGKGNEATFRLLNSADLEQMSLEQWEIFLKLIELKYDYSTKNFICEYFESQFNSIENTDTQAEHSQKEKILRSKLSAVLNAMNRLDEVTKSDEYPSTEQKSIAVLEHISTLFKYSDPQYNELDGTYNKTTLKQIHQFEDLLNIYKQLNKKDFGSVVKSTLKLVEPVIEKDKFELEIKDKQLQLKNKELEQLFSLVGKKKKNKLFQLPDKLEFNNNISFRFDGENITIKDSNNNEDYIKIEDFKEDFKKLKYLNNITSLETLNHLKDISCSFFKYKPQIKLIFKTDSVNMLDKLMVNPVNEDFNKKINKELDKLRYLHLMVDILDNPKQISSNQIYNNLNLHYLNKNLHLFNESGQLLVKTATFFTDIMAARDEDGVYRAIESAVAPPNSYMTKRLSNNSFTLNGYVGGYVGYQTPNSHFNDYKKSFTFGITAPIGITYSKPRYGVHLQLLDLGNLVGHYIWNSNTEYDKQEVSVKEIFSPGLNFLWYLKNSPFALFAGYKYIPLEKRFDQNLGSYINKRGLEQLTFGIQIDIPFFTISRW